VPISSRLARKLEETLGVEPAEDFVSWTDTIETHRAELQELRHEMQINFGRLEAKIDQTRSAVEAAIDKRTADLMKWSFVFWVGAVGAIAALAVALRN